jgi:hypothetical protein
LNSPKPPNKSIIINDSLYFLFPEFNTQILVFNQNRLEKYSHDSSNKIILQDSLVLQQKIALLNPSKVIARKNEILIFDDKLQMLFKYKLNSGKQKAQQIVHENRKLLDKVYKVIFNGNADSARFALDCTGKLQKQHYKIITVDNLNEEEDRTFYICEVICAHKKINNDTEYRKTTVVVFLNEYFQDWQNIYVLSLNNRNLIPLLSSDIELKENELKCMAINILDRTKLFILNYNLNSGKYILKQINLVDSAKCLSQLPNFRFDRNYINEPGEYLNFVYFPFFIRNDTLIQYKSQELYITKNIYQDCPMTYCLALKNKPGNYSNQLIYLNGDYVLFNLNNKNLVKEYNLGFNSKRSNSYKFVQVGNNLYCIGQEGSKLMLTKFKLII